MPNKNGTGPAGQGSRTGRGAGNCNGQGGASRFPGRGLGRGGRGRGFGRGFGGLGVSSGQEPSWLENLLSTLQNIAERLDASKEDK